MKPTEYEMPSPESNDLEPLAKALVALRREEEPIAPSAELRRRVEARLDAIESNTSGAVLTKEKSMSISSTNRFRLRDWIFIGGGSLAAAAATTIIFWPPPKANVAQVAPKRMVEMGEWQQSGDATSPAMTASNRPASESATPSGGLAEGWKMKKQAMSKDDGYARASSAGAGGSDFQGAAGGGPGAPRPQSNPDGGFVLRSPTDDGLPNSSGPNPYPPPALTIDPSGNAPGRSDGPVAAVNTASPTTSPTSQTELSSAASAGGAPKDQFALSQKAASLQSGATRGAGGMPGMGGGGYAGMMPGGGGKGLAGGMPGMPGMAGGMSGMAGGGAGGMPGAHANNGQAWHENYYRARVAQAERSKNIDRLAKLSESELAAESFHYSDGLVPGGAGEQYNTIVENAFLSPTADPLSTFSIDVDTAAYSNVRRFLSAGQVPPPAAVRIEEMVNYFSYHYATPKGREPFAVNMEAAECPWKPGHLLLRVGLKGKEVERKARPASNLVFLLDVSGSMADENKLPLLKTTMTMLVNELTENDRVTIVTYAGDAGLKLEPTSGDQKQKINDVISSLSAGGSTNGSAGIELAYQKAAEAFIKEGTNRVILATDGDLNVGVTSDDALVKLIKEKAAGGTFLTVLGFGEGNLKDGKLEQIADNGNGMYGYIDSVREGRKMMVEQLSGSLVTIAKDVKIQIEFNPAQIHSYRLLGYENRVMAAADFNNDKKDAGEIGAGHTVTALYELIPVDATRKEQPRPDVEPLKYQKAGLATRAVVAETGEPKALTEAAGSGELLTLKLRYKEPDGVESRLIEFPLKEKGGRFNSASKDFQFAAAVASFGMILRGSQHRGSGNPSAVAEIAAGALGEDPNGLRAEFVDLVRRAEKLGIK